MQKLGKLDWALSLVDSVEDLAPEIESFLRHGDQEEFTLNWQIETTGEKGSVRLLYDQAAPAQGGVTTKHKRTVTDYRSGYKRSRAVTATDVIREAQQTMREYLDALLAKDGPSQVDKP